jgi:hypothetical protein
MNNGKKLSKQEEIKKENAELNKMNYPAGEDIYARNEKQDGVPGENQKEFGEDETLFEDPAKDLDVPGAELDDADEAIGEEDEENNYYSLGGDNHEDLEESNEDEVQ